MEHTTAWSDVMTAPDEQKAAAEAMVIVSSSFDAIVGRTPDGTVTSWNAGAERVYGYRADEMIGRSMEVLEPAGQIGDLDSITERLRLGGRVEPFEATRLCKDGTLIQVETMVSPITDASGALVAVSSVSRDISERKRSQALISGQARLLALVAEGRTLADMLDLVARFVEEQSGTGTPAIMLLDHDCASLHLGAAPHLPSGYRTVIDGTAVGPAVASSGTSAHRREPVVVSDIASDPLWSDHREPALAAGLRACSSRPILASDGSLLGVFDLYYRQTGDPPEEDVRLAQIAVHVVSIAVERSRSEEALRTSEQRYRDLFENANEPIATVTLDNTITDCNAAFERVLGYSRSELVGESLRSFLTAEDYATAVLQGERKLTGEATGTSFEQEFIAKDGTSVVMSISSRLIEQHGRAIGIQGICRDITADKKAQAGLLRLANANRHQALHDSLTTLPNRASFRARVAQAMEACGQGAPPFGVFMIDFNRFKEINDAFGHAHGDTLLLDLAQRLRATVRRSDTVARLGGDEFAMLIANVTDGPESAVQSAVARIQSALRDPFVLDGVPIHAEVSIGSSRYPSDGSDVDMLLQRADIAMYVAKRKGLTHVAFKRQFARDDSATLVLLADLPHAIRSGGLHLHYQPQAELRTGTIARVEALVRWQHPTRGAIAPDDFVPSAERTTLIEPLTAFVLDEALAQCSRWEAAGLYLGVAVNLSMRNLHEDTLAAQVETLLRKWRLPSDRITLEITESAIAVDPQRTRAIIQQLSRIGVRIAIDDFGIGYTALSHLARLPVDEIKIDRSFVTNLDTESDHGAIVRSIIALGHDLGLEVVAEGVETQAVLEKLETLGCDRIQGYLLGRPVPPAVLAKEVGGMRLKPSGGYVVAA